MNIFQLLSFLNLGWRVPLDEVQVRDLNIISHRLEKDGRELVIKDGFVSLA